MRVRYVWSAEWKAKFHHAESLEKYKGCIKKGIPCAMHLHGWATTTSHTPTRNTALTQQQLPSLRDPSCRFRIPRIKEMYIISPAITQDKI